MASYSRASNNTVGGVMRLWQLATAILSLVQEVMTREFSAADYYVRSLPGQPDGPLLKMHAGHVEITPEHNGNLFFWHFANRHIANRPRTVIWLNGGPGCSSMDGALMEIGPYRLKDDHTLRDNDGSWDEFANLLFVDNPVGTGFSYVDTDSFLHELNEMADQFVVFLEKWFKIFPEYEADDLYIAGESYAGQHIPYIAKAILDRNTKARAAGKAEWKLSGLLIGNGWIAPKEQYLSYVPFAYAEGLIQNGTQAATNVEAQLSQCIIDLGKPESAHRVDTSACEGVLIKLLDATTKGGRCINMYDIRKTDTSPDCGMNWPADLVNVTPYLRRQDVTDAIHINKDKRTGWTECSGSVGSTFRARHSNPSIEFLPHLLESGIPIVLFSGDRDLICNHLGTEEFMHTMKWSGGTGFELSKGVWAPKQAWTFEGEAAGIYQSARNLTYVLFYNSSHMVPFDYPRRTRDMLDRFMGVDIASIGGHPADSRIDGEKAGLETSVGGHPNSTAAEVEERKKLKAAEWKAYYKSGEAALVVVIIAAAAWGVFVWRGRRKERNLGQRYSEVPTGNGHLSLNGFRPKRRDVEAADFDENELEELNHGGQMGGGSTRDLDAERFSLSSDSDEGGKHQKSDKRGNA